MRLKSFIGFLASRFFWPRKKICMALNLCENTDIVSLLPFSSPNSFGEKNPEAQKYYCVNKRLRITLIRTLTYLGQEPTEKGLLCLEDRPGSEIATPVWKAQAEMSTSYLKKWWKPVSPTLPWFFVLGKIPKGTTNTCRRKIESSSVIRTTVFPGVIKSLEMES